jgi:hypothetical protein
LLVVLVVSEVQVALAVQVDLAQRVVPEVAAEEEEVEEDIHLSTSLTQVHISVITHIITFMDTVVAVEADKVLVVTVLLVVQVLHTMLMVTIQDLEEQSLPDMVAIMAAAVAMA